MSLLGWLTGTDEVARGTASAVAAVEGAYQQRDAAKTSEIAFLRAQVEALTKRLAEMQSPGVLRRVDPPPPPPKPAEKQPSVGWRP